MLYTRPRCALRSGVVAKRLVNVRLEPVLIEAMDMAARDRDVSRTEWLTRLISEAVETKPKQSPDLDRAVAETDGAKCAGGKPRKVRTGSGLVMHECATCGRRFVDAGYAQRPHAAAK